MLFKHGHLEKKLRERGREAQAEILSIKTEGEGGSARALFADDSDLTTSWFLCRLKLRITPQGEEPFEATVHTRLNTLKSKGDTVPVLYSPDDHDQVVVDYQADAQAEMDRVDALQRHNREWDEKYGHAEVAPLPPELQQLMDQDEAERRASADS